MVISCKLLIEIQAPGCEYEESLNSRYAKRKTVVCVSKIPRVWHMSVGEVTLPFNSQLLS